MKTIIKLEAVKIKPTSCGKIENTKEKPKRKRGRRRKGEKQRTRDKDV